jgi:hypothetical protein
MSRTGMPMNERVPDGDRSTSRVWWAAASAGGVLAAVQLALLAVTWRAPIANAYEARPSALAYLLVAMMFLVMGLVVVRQRPGNVIGWMLAGIGLAFLLYQTAVQYTLYGLLARSPPPGVGVAAVLTQGLWMPAFGLLPPLLLVYPTGRALSPAWRWAIRSSIVAGVVGPILVTIALWSTREQAAAIVVGNGAPALAPVARLVLTVTVGGVTATLLAGLVAGIVSLVTRWRRAEGVERLQLQWLVVSGSLLGGAVLASSSQVLSVEVPRTVADVLLVSGLASMPVTIAMAVTRYRLFGIVRIVSRTVTYTLVTAILTGVYGACILTASFVLPGDPSGRVVAASTLTAAALFRPARERVRSMVDRRFDRARYDAVRIVESFSAHVRQEVDLETLADDLREAATGAVHPASVSLWLRPPQA